jgi:hypothetical protein|nr:MAG TPA: hypothetical protein [Caudoviricetes sp.]
MDCIAAALEFLMRETLARHGLTAEIKVTKIGHGGGEEPGEQKKADRLQAVPAVRGQLGLPG